MDEKINLPFPFSIAVYHYIKEKRDLFSSLILFFNPTHSSCHATTLQCTIETVLTLLQTDKSVFNDYNELYDF